MGTRACCRRPPERRLNGPDFAPTETPRPCTPTWTRS